MPAGRNPFLPSPILTFVTITGLAALVFLTRTPDKAADALHIVSKYVSRYFPWEALTRSRTAIRHGWSNSPGPAAQANLEALVRNLLDPAHHLIGRPWDVLSGYRSLAVNREVGGAAQSQHMAGQAVDVKIEGMASSRVASVIAFSGLPFDQVIWYDPEYGGHVHLSYVTDRRNRRQVLHCTRANGQKAYIPWRTT